MEREKELNDFFDQYAARFNAALKSGTADVEKTAASFADFFVEASPLGVNGGKNDAQFREMIPKGYAFYQSIGVTSMDIVSKETTILDDLHAMTKVHWESNYVKKDKSKGSIAFAVIYFVQTREKVHKIFAYITGDEQAAFKEHGLI
jgi:hypothetical protein